MSKPNRKCPICNERPVMLGSSRCGACDRIFFNIAEVHGDERARSGRAEFSGEFLLERERRIREYAARAASRSPLFDTTN